MLYDTVIIGSGPSGLQAAIYLARANKKVLVVSKDRGALNTDHIVENYFGFKDGISGNNLIDEGVAQAKRFGVDFESDEIVGFNYLENLVLKGLKQNYDAKTILISTGTSRRKPRIENFEKYLSHGISFCVSCDAFLYRNKTVALVGNSSYAKYELNELKDYSNDIYLLTNEQIVDVEFPDNVKIITTKIKAFTGDDNLSGVEFVDGRKIDVAGVFLALNSASAADLAQTIGIEVENNRIKVDENMETTIPGMYASGDATGTPYQISKAVYEGMKAAYSILEYLKDNF